MENLQTRPQSDQKDPHVSQNGPILAWDETRSVSPLESSQKSPSPCADSPVAAPAPGNPRSENAIKRACTRFYNAWETFLLTPWKMFVLLFIGTAFAIGHHFFYLSLDDTEGDAQSLMFRYGTIIAFCAKASLGTAVAMAFQQRAWLVVRRRTARLDTIDSIFTANTEFTSLLDWRAMKRAKVSTCLALYCWLTPLVVILTSETLSTVATSLSFRASCPAVRTLNFANEETQIPGHPLKINNGYEFSLSVYNATFLLTEDDPPEADLTKDEFYYFDTPSVRYSQLILPKAILQGQAVARDDAGLDACSENWNCSYVIEFIAPGYKCEELASGVGSKVKKLGESEAPFDTSMLAPEGNHTYYALTYRGQYSAQTASRNSRGVPSYPPPYPKNLGAFRTEPILWIGYATVNDTSIPQPSSRDEADWYDAYTPVIFGCEHYEVNYTVKFEYNGGAQSYNITSRDYLRRVVNTRYLPDEEDPNEKLKDPTAATPEKNYVLPSDRRKYRRTAVYHSLGRGLRGYLEGSLSMPNHITSSQVYLTPLVTQPNFLPVDNLPQAIQKMYENIIISLLSEPSFIAVSWASNGKPSGYARSGPETSYPCVRSQLSTIFRYNWPQLVTVYAASIALALIGVLLGLRAFREEGLMRDMKPSSIIEATRSLSLNELGPGGELDKRNVRVGYGLVQQHAGESVRSFGLEGDVVQQAVRS